jgi:hypothetical protein
MKGPFARLVVELDSQDILLDRSRKHIAVAKNNGQMAFRDEEYGRFTVEGVFSVVPAKAGIQNLDPDQVRGDHAVGATIPANRAEVLAIAIIQHFSKLGGLNLP